MVGQTNFFPPPLLVPLLDPGSEMDKNQDPGSGIQHPRSATHCLELELGSAEVFRHGEHVGQDLVREAHQPTVLDVRRLVLSTKNSLLLTFWSGSGSADP
jgi:hypothetical protein